MIDATYFDGQTTRRHAVTIIMHKGLLAMRGSGIRRTERLSSLAVSERLQHAPRIVRFPDGGFIETSDTGLKKMLAANGYREPWVVRWQQHWPLSLIALISLLTLLIAGYQWGLPWVADEIAQRLPPTIEKKIGDAQMGLIDGQFMQPSRLDVVDQARLRRLFSELKQPRGDRTSYRLEFRHSPMGPNAFALPNGVIVMTDQLVRLAENDQAVLAVLGHELGHVQRRHSIRSLLQAMGVGVVLNLFIGDVSSVMAAVPTLLLEQKYSRDFEREADQYAIDMMQANSVPLSPMADLFEKMSALDANASPAASPADAGSNGRRHEDEDDEDDDDDDESAPAQKKCRKSSAESDSPSDYLSSHPSDAERIKKLRAADQKK